MCKDFIRKLRILLIRMKAGCYPTLPSSSLSIIVAPHPDDEVFGCTGLMQRLISEGKQVELILMTGGGKSHAGCCDVDEMDLIRHRRELTKNAASVYGLQGEHIHFLDYPDGGISQEHPQKSVLVSLLQHLVEGQASVAVFYPHRKGEGWSDHLATSSIIGKLCDEICPKATQYEYCVWFWFYNFWKMDWKHACLLKMNEKEFAIKLKAIDEYIEPKAPCGKPWSGVLPKVFLWANKWNKELYFKVK